MSKKVLIIPNCTDLNRGDQALVLETSKVIRKVYDENVSIYMMTDGETTQCKKYGLNTFKDILSHPSRFTSTKKNNINYNKMIKLEWGLVAVLDYLNSLLLLNKITRKLSTYFMKKEKKDSIRLYEECDSCFVKGGGFLHDYSGGLVGLYTMYYQTFHIKLALAMKKKVYIMPNSYGPFKSKITKKMLNKLLDKCTFVTARESISADGNKNGLERNIQLYPDLAFYLSRQKDRLEILKKQFGIKEEKKYVAITVRPYRFYQYNNPKEKYENYKKTFVKFIEFLNSKGYTPLFVVHTRAINDHENDELCIKEITELIKDKKLYQIIKDDNLDCYDLKEIYGKCQYIVGTRFHSVIFSVEQNVPAIAITYGGNKGDGIMKDMDLSEYAIKIGDLSYELLKRKFEQLEREKEKVIKKIEIYKIQSKKEYNKLIDEIKKERE